MTSNAAEKNLSEILKIIAEIDLARPDGVGAVYQPWIVAGEQSGLPTHIAATESVSSCMRMTS